ncbi:MAG: triphosphoribosyl-dephospho-CoA synthase [Candidatus Nezhaarchaeales archaeon]
MNLRVEEEASNVMIKAQLAALLEVSAYPKPGNVHRLRDRWGKKFEHFVAGSVAIGPIVKEAFMRGYRAWLQGDLSSINIGKLIEKAVKHQLKVHSAGNTHLGVIMLFIPIASSIPMWIAGSRDISDLGVATLEVLKTTTLADAVALMRGIKLAKPSGLGRPPKGLPDALKEKQRIDMTLYEILESSSRWDGVAGELVSGLRTSLKVGLPSLIKTYEKTKDLNIAIVHCFLSILSHKPDTFIARNVGLAKAPNASIDKAVELGMQEARRISERAREALEAGGLTTIEGRKVIKDLDEELEAKGPAYNPGTTADLTAASIFLALLSGANLL